MKKLFFLFLTLLFVITNWTSAHGGVSKNIGNTIVFLNQAPLSPLVGEKVEMIFTITDDNFQALKNTDVTINLIQTVSTDASQDKILETKYMKTDENGVLTYAYNFINSDYYDVDLSFRDPISGEENQTGFLLQPRQVKTESNIAVVATAAGIGLLFGIVCGWFMQRKSKQPDSANQPPIEVKKPNSPRRIV